MVFFNGYCRNSHFHPGIDQDRHDPRQRIACFPDGLHGLFSRALHRLQYPSLVGRIILPALDEQIPGGVSVLVSAVDEVGNAVVLMESEETR